MRVAIFVALAAASAGFFACSDDASTSPSRETDAGGEDAAEGEEADAGEERAPSGCLLKSTGFLSGKKAESVARSDVPNGAAWTDVENALRADGKMASITLSEGQESAALRVSDFGFAIPDGAATWGIEVELKRQAPEGGITDARIDVEIENKTTRYKLMDVPWPKSAMGTHAYGQAVDTWGADLFPSDFNRTSFAAKLAVKRAEGAAGSVTGLVDSLRVAVHYCPPK